MRKVTLATEETKILQEAYEELKEGTAELAECQKHIRIADQSKVSWRAVAAYKRLRIRDDSEKDNRNVKLASREK